MSYIEDSRCLAVSRKGLHSTGDEFAGALNNNILLVGPILQSGPSTVLRRYPIKGGPQEKYVRSSIMHEYDEIGFINTGGGFRRRSPSEQVKFARKSAVLGLKVMPPLVDGNNFVENWFFDNAEQLDVYLSHASDEEAARCTQNVFMDIYNAHSLGVVYGDRWSENILVLPGSTIVQIDFDIEIEGRYAKEFEIAQVAYYVLSGAKAKVIPQLANLLKVSDNKLSLLQVEAFLRGHADFFQHDEKYGGLIAEVETLIDLIHKEAVSPLRNNHNR